MALSRMDFDIFQKAVETKTIDMEGRDVDLEDIELMLMVIRLKQEVHVLNAGKIPSLMELGARLHDIRYER